MLASLAIGAAPVAPPISMHISAWGLTLHDWQIAPDGKITATSREPPVVAPVPGVKLVTRRTRASPARYRWIAARIAGLGQWAGHEPPCQVQVTDQDSFRLRIGDGPVIAVYDGCAQADTQALAATLRQADDQITAWTKDAPIVAQRSAER